MTTNSSNTLLRGNHDTVSVYVVVPKNGKHFWLSNSNGNADIKHASTDGEINNLHKDFYEAWLVSNISFDETINVETDLKKIKLDKAPLLGEKTGGKYCAIKYSKRHSDYYNNWKTLNERNIMNIKMINGVPDLNEIYLTKNIPNTNKYYDKEIWEFKTDASSSQVVLFNGEEKNETGIITNSTTRIGFYRVVDGASMRLTTGKFEDVGLANKANYACLQKTGYNTTAFETPELSLTDFRETIDTNKTTYYQTTVTDLTNISDKYYGNELLLLTVAPYAKQFYGVDQIDVLCGVPENNNNFLVSN